MNIQTVQTIHNTYPFTEWDSGLYDVLSLCATLFNYKLKRT